MLLRICGVLFILEIIIGIIVGIYLGFKYYQYKDELAGFNDLMPSYIAEFQKEDFVKSLGELISCEKLTKDNAGMQITEPVQLNFKINCVFENSDADFVMQVLLIDDKWILNAENSRVISNYFEFLKK